MNKKVVLKRIFHRDAWQLAIVFGYDEKLRSVISSVPGINFSGTHKCYYVDDNEDNLKLLLKILKDNAEIDISQLTRKEMQERRTFIPGNKSISGIEAGSSSDTEAKMPDVSGCRTIVETSNDEESDSFSDRYHYFTKPGIVEFRIREKDGLLVIKFPGRYEPEWISEIKTYGRCFYDKRQKEWLLRYSKMTCDSLADYFALRGVAVNFKRQVVDEELVAARKITGDEIRGRDLNSKALNGLDSLAMFLDENRYSPRTRESYLSMLEIYFRYFSEKDPVEITEEEISQFIHDFIIRLDYSTAYQNQMISAIKTYYTISGKGKVNPDYFERPRRRRALPKVFSREEVSRILSSGRNIKHKLLLWIIYSCGLRRSEVINIMLDDLDRDRNVLFIREGKGRVDRIVPISRKVWEKIDEYMSSYRPRVYLFEGQAGGRYSSESVYRVFKEALRRAGINKETGVHSLRHSYATHLHENGLDIRYIQELLGHRSTRTTEIYTHVSRRNLIQVRSPIEDLDVK